MLADIASIRQRIASFGARPCHEDRILRLWCGGMPLETPGSRPGDQLPARLRASIPRLAGELDAIASIRSAHAAEDGAERLLVDLADGQAIETVLLPRAGVCVSTQVGCAVGCTFCMTGRGGLSRQLVAAEIVAQVALARRRRAVRKVVFMGMGEPAHNLENVLEAIRLLGTLGGIGHKNLVFSTVGDARVFDALPREPVRPALALSLHSTRAELRATLMPRAPRIPPDELVARAQAYSRATGYPIQYQWTLLDGVNDGPDEIDGIVRLLAGQYAVMNLIPYNTVPGLPFGRPAAERAAAIARALHRRGVLAKLRRSAGQDVDAGCGQLCRRAMPIAVAAGAARPADGRFPATA
ncbi:MAG: RNA methyltransferase [Lautropia sp.]